MSCRPHHDIVLLQIPGGQGARFAHGTASGTTSRILEYGNKMYEKLTTVLYFQFFSSFHPYSCPFLGPMLLVSTDLVMVSPV